MKSRTQTLAQTLNRTIAYVDLNQIARNLELLSGVARSHYSDLRGAVPMVKANAYGHGIVQVASKLDGQKNVYALGVATLDEAVALRRAKVKRPIWIFSETAPFSEPVTALCEKFALTPVLHREEDVYSFLKLKKRKLKLQLKFNTGMNRLGIEPSASERIRAALFKALDRAQISELGICTHFAMSEAPGAGITKKQVELFRSVSGVFSCFDNTYIHCANTDAILHEERLALGRFCNVIRPGIGLYGYAGALGKKLGLKPALHWSARVLTSRKLDLGDAVGYGATYRAARAGEAQAVLGVGYGDGLMRVLSNHGLLVSHRGRMKRSRFLGRISMDLSSLNLEAKSNDWVTLIGDSQEQGELLAKNAGTIVYEILTNISSRVPRTYGSV